MKISLKERKLPSGKISLLIEYYKGSEISPEGKRRHIREFENLQLYLDSNAKTADEKRKNKENLVLAKKILAVREAEFYQGRFDLKNNIKSKRRFLDFLSEKMEQKISSPNIYGNWSATLVHLKKCISLTLTFEALDVAFVTRVPKYFDTEAKTKSETLLSENSKYSYFNKFKATLRAAFDEGYTSINYGAKIKSFEQQESQREYLTHEELQKLANTECKYPVLKRAFI